MQFASFFRLSQISKTISNILIEKILHISVPSQLRPRCSRVNCVWGNELFVTPNVRHIRCPLGLSSHDVVAGQLLPAQTRLAGVSQAGRQA